jgi:hypothetical protein
VRPRHALRHRRGCGGGAERRRQVRGGAGWRPPCSWSTRGAHAGRRPRAARPTHLSSSDGDGLRSRMLRSLLRLSIESVRCRRLCTWRFRCWRGSGMGNGREEGKVRSCSPGCGAAWNELQLTEPARSPAGRLAPPCPAARPPRRRRPLRGCPHRPRRARPPPARRPGQTTGSSARWRRGRAASRRRPLPRRRCGRCRRCRRALPRRCCARCREPRRGAVARAARQLALQGFFPPAPARGVRVPQGPAAARPRRRLGPVGGWATWRYRTGGRPLAQAHIAALHRAAPRATLRAAPPPPLRPISRLLRPLSVPQDVVYVAQERQQLPRARKQPGRDRALTLAGRRR